MVRAGFTRTASISYAWALEGGGGRMSAFCFWLMQQCYGCDEAAGN